MKSRRQKRINKHAKLVKKQKWYKYVALTISAIAILIPLYIKYVYG